MAAERSDEAERLEALRTDERALRLELRADEFEEPPSLPEQALKNNTAAPKTAKANVDFGVVDDIA